MIKMRNTQESTQIKVVNAVIPTAGAAAAMTATVVNTTGYGRVMFILSTGAAAAGATIDFKIQSSATSGGSYADVTSAVLTQILAASGASKQFVIDMPVQTDKNFLKVVGTVGTDTFANSTIAVLYRGISYPVSTAYATEIVTL